MRFYFVHNLLPHTGQFRPARYDNADGSCCLAVVVACTTGSRDIYAATSVLAGYQAQLMLTEPATIDAGVDTRIIFHPGPIEGLNYVDLDE